MSFSAQSLGFQFTPLREGRPALNYTAEPFQQISIHAPPRGATDSGAEFRSAHHISIHAPPRGATTHPRHDCRHVVNFNSRPSARGDGWAGACAPLPLAFQFTPLREGRPELASKLSDACKLFQFTPLREGRLPQEFSMRRAALISIHAPPRGATMDFTHSLSACRISIHAPPRGAT